MKADGRRCPQGQRVESGAYVHVRNLRGGGVLWPLLPRRAQRRVRGLPGLGGRENLQGLQSW